MDVRNQLKSFLPGLLLLMSYSVTHAQFVDTVYAYLPAPGQYTNSEQIGRPAAAQSIVGGLDGLVSLGAYGGYIVVGFSNSIENNPDNPYGVDFTIFGNPTSTWSEPGIVQVMRDDNGNGKPDDEWYEIAGSDHSFSSTVSDYQITYKSPGDGVVDDVSWTDTRSLSGIIEANSYHQQPYYPMSAYFPDVNTSELVFAGLLLAGVIDESDASQVKSLHRAFGYADNTKVISVDENMPDNPYTEEIEGSGGDAFDISWARDAEGNYVDLDKIDFIRIYTGMNASSGWLGEVSTEIIGVRDVAPQAASGVTEMVVMEDLPFSVLKDETLDLKAHYFQRGRLSTGAISWTASPADVVTIENGILTAQKAGNVTLRAALESNPSVYTEHELDVLSGGHATINLSATTVQKNDHLELKGNITDDNGNVIPGMTVEWLSGDTHIFTIEEEDGQPYLRALAEGEAWLYLQAKENTTIRDSVQIKVISESAAKEVYVAVKTEEHTIFPRQSLMIDLFDLNNFVDNRSNDYSIQSVPDITVAHVLVKVFQALGLADDFRLRDDEAGNNQLYVWKVPEEDNGSTALYYGYGGSSASVSARKTWLVRINQQNMVNGLEQNKINNGDEILLYHISDHSDDWTLTQLTADKDSVKTNEAVTVKYMTYTCSMNSERQIIVENSNAVENASVSVENGSTLQTNEYGEVSFTFSQGGDYFIHAGINQLNVNVGGSSGLGTIAVKQLDVYPNPASDFLEVISNNQSGRLAVYDTSGRLCMSLDLSGNTRIDISGLQNGIYLLQMVTGNEILQQKVIKQ